jgi:hypothetical protein
MRFTRYPRWEPYEVTPVSSPLRGEPFRRKMTDSRFDVKLAFAIKEMMPFHASRRCIGWHPVVIARDGRITLE